MEINNINKIRDNITNRININNNNSSKFLETKFTQNEFNKKYKKENKKLFI